MAVCQPREIGGPLPDQVAAAGHRAGDARLLAGPGTGKTKTLVDLVVSLIRDGSAQPSEILCLTFTRAAAAGLKRKIRAALGTDDVPEVYTLHGFALKQLMAGRVFGPQALRVADDWEERNIVLEDLKVMLGDGTIPEVRGRLKALAAAWETRPEDDPSTVHPDRRFVGALKRHQRQYGYVLRAELVYRLRAAMLEDPGFALTGTYTWVIVDEYQDLNRCDIAVIEAIAATGANLFVAGDDDQSIYQHLRHAHPEGIRQFCSMRTAADLRLRTCIRCDSRILDVAMGVIAEEPNRTAKDLEPHETAGPGVVEVLRFDDGAQEAEGIARLTRKLVDAGLDRHEIMVLIRSDKNGVFSGPIDEAMRRHRVEAIVRTKEESFLGEPAGRVLISYLHLVLNLADHLAWRTLLREARVGIGDEAFAVLHRLSVDNGEQPLADTLDAVEADPTLAGRFGARIAREVTAAKVRVDSMRADVAALDDVADQVEAVINHLVSTPESDAAADEVRGLISLYQPASLRDLLGAISLRGNEEEDIAPNQVNIMTMHKAKGLDACVVIIAAADTELMPGTGNPDEERRLFYVSLTRARHGLWITWVGARRDRQAHSGTGDPRHHHRTEFLRDSGLPSRPGFAAIDAYVVDEAALSPLPR
jgi:DNA helicase-2/ATP-dependent DNA helicase PcrA